VHNVKTKVGPEWNLSPCPPEHAGKTVGWRIQYWDWILFQWR